mgnify:CR=1 FL=1
MCISGRTQSREPDIFFACGRVEGTLFFLHIFVVDENVEEKEDNVQRCRRRKGELTIPPRTSCIC